MKDGEADQPTTRRTRSQTKISELPLGDVKRKGAVEFVIVSGAPDEGDDGGQDLDGEYARFLRKLSRKEKADLVKLEKELCARTSFKPLKYRILVSDMPREAKIIALNRLVTFGKTSPTDADFSKASDWFETLLRIPFGRYVDLPITKYDEPARINEYLQSTRTSMDQHVYGMSSVKNIFQQVLAQHITNPESTCNAFGLEGAPGVGKTLIVTMLSETLGRPFRLVALGGSKDSSFLQGHDFTFLGAKCGLLVEILLQAGVMNPVILFDELDKLSDSPQGEEVAGALIHLIDATQNRLIQDRYFAGVDLDFSRALFFFSYNNESKVDPILLDRIVRLHVPGFTVADKVAIAHQHLLPQAYKNIGMHPEFVKVSDETIRYIISAYTAGEEGVRSLKQSISQLCMELNLLLLTQKSVPRLSFSPAAPTMPVHILPSDVDILLANHRPRASNVPFGMYT